MESTTGELGDLALTKGTIIEDDDVEGSAPPVHLAFLEEPEGAEELQRHRFPNKAGGAPTWLDPVNLPSGESILCDFCGDPLRFAIQVYAPFLAAYHRTLFMFMCPSMSCLLEQKQSKEAGIIGLLGRRRSVKVFRCQLPRDNAFYSSDNDGDDDESDGTTACTAGANATPLCDWCATWKAEVACTVRGGAAKYCSEKHRELHLQSSDCRSSDIVVSSALGSSHEAVPFAVWPEYIMNMEEEKLQPINSNTDCSSVPSPALQEQEQGEEVCNVDGEDEDDTAAWMASFVEEEEEDAAWAAFRARVSVANQGAQVLRYCSEEGARPL